MRASAKRLTLSAAVAAAYAVLSFFSGIFGLAFGPVQCRFSEALCLLPFLFPETVWGLFVGCLITNLMSAYGPMDVIFGSLATLLAAIMTAKTKNRFLAPLPAVIMNGFIVGGVITWLEAGATGAFPALFLYNFSTIAIGEAVACYGLGLLLISYLPKVPFFREMVPPERQRLIK